MLRTERINPNQIKAPAKISVATIPQPFSHVELQRLHYCLIAWQCLSPAWISKVFSKPLPSDTETLKKELSNRLHFARASVMDKDKVAYTQLISALFTLSASEIWTLPHYPHKALLGNDRLQWLFQQLPDTHRPCFAKSAPLPHPTQHNENSAPTLHQLESLIERVTRALTQLTAMQQEQHVAQQRYLALCHQQNDLLEKIATTQGSPFSKQKLVPITTQSIDYQTKLEKPLRNAGQLLVKLSSANAPDQQIIRSIAQVLMKWETKLTHSYTQNKARHQQALSQTDRIQKRIEALHKRLEHVSQERQTLEQEAYQIGVCVAEEPQGLILHFSRWFRGYIAVSIKHKSSHFSGYVDNIEYSLAANGFHLSDVFPRNCSLNHILRIELTTEFREPLGEIEIPLTHDGHLLNRLQHVLKFSTPLYPIEALAIPTRSFVFTVPEHRLISGPNNSLKLRLNETFSGKLIMECNSALVWTRPQTKVSDTNFDLPLQELLEKIPLNNTSYRCKLLWYDSSDDLLRSTTFGVSPKFELYSNTYSKPNVVDASYHHARWVFSFGCNQEFVRFTRKKEHNHKTPTTQQQKEFFQAIRNKDIEKVKAYLAAGYDPNVTEHLAYTPLHFACMNDYYRSEIVHALLEAGAEPLKSAEVFGERPMHCAIGTNNARAIEQLYRYHFFMGIPTNTHEPCVLVKSNNHRLNGYQIAIHPYTHRQLRRLDAELEWKKSLLFKYTREGNLKEITHLLEDFYPDYIDEFGRTPLQIASNSETPFSQELVSLFLAHGADPNHTDHLGTRPIDEAIGTDNLNVTKLFPPILQTDVDFRPFSSKIWSSLSEDKAPALPIISVILEKNRLQIYRFDTNGIRKPLYNKPHSGTFDLSGFADCRVALQNQTLTIECDTPDLQIFIDSTFPLVIQDKMTVQGDITVLAPALTLHTTIGSSQGRVVLKAYSLEHRSGLIKGESGVVVEANDLVIQAPIQSPNRIDVLHRGENYEVDHTQFSTPGLLQFNWLNDKTLETSFNNPTGSLTHRSTGTLTLLADQQAQQSIALISEKALQIGSANHEVNIDAQLGTIELQGHSLLLQQGCCVAAQGITVKSQTTFRCQSNNSQGFAWMTEGRIDFSANKSIHWSHLQLFSFGLQIKTPLLTCEAGYLYVNGDVHWDVAKGKLEPTFVDKPGYRDNNWGWEGAHEAYRDFHPTREIDAKTFLGVTGSFHNLGHLTVHASHFAHNIFTGSKPDLLPFIPVLHWSEHSYCGNSRRSKCSWQVNQRTQTLSPVLGTQSAAAPLEIEQECLQVQGVLSTLDLQLRGIAQGRIGLIDLNIQLPTPKPFDPFVDLSQFVRTSQLFVRTLQGQSIFKARLPAFNVEPGLAPIIILQEDNQLALNTQGLRKLYPFMVEQTLLLQSLMETIQQGFLNTRLVSPAQILAFLRQEAEHCFRTPEACARITREGITSHDRPMIVYVKQRVHYSNHQSEVALKPMVYLPEALFNNIRKRYGEGGLFSLDGIQLTGSGKNSHLQISGVLEANSNISIDQFDAVNIIRRTVMEGRWVEDEQKSRGLLGLGRKKQITKRYVVDITPQPGAELLSHEGSISIEAQQLHTEGVAFASPTEVHIRSQDYRQTESLARTHRAVTNTQYSLGGKTNSTFHVAEEQYLPTQVFTPRFRIEANRVYADGLISTNPPQYKTQELILNQAARLREETRLYQASLAREARRTAKRKQRQSLLKSGGILVVSTIVTAGTSTALIKANLLAKNSLNLALTQGAIMGGTSATLLGQNPIQGATEGALFAGIGFGVGELLGEANGTLQTIAHESLRSMTIASAQTLLHDGNFIENLLVAGTAGMVVGAFNLDTNELSGTQMLLTGAQSATVGVTTILLTGSNDYATNLIAATIGGLCQRLGNRIGEKLAEQKTTVTPTAVVEQIQEVITQSGFTIGEQKIAQALKTHPSFQGDTKQIQTQLIALGKQDAPHLSTHEALTRGFQKAMIAILNALVPTAQASTASQGSLKQSRLLEIDVEKHHPDLFRQRWLLEKKQNLQPFSANQLVTSNSQKRDQTQWSTTAAFLRGFKDSDETYGLTKFGSGVVSGLESLKEAVIFLAEEIARVRLGQPTITVNAFSAIEKSLRAEVLRYQQGELTVTESAFRASKQFALSEGQKLSQGKPTETGKLITYGYAQFKQIPIDQLAGKIVEFTGECFAFGVLTKGVQITGRAAIRLGKASTQGLEAAEVGLAKFNATYKIRPPVTFQFEAVSNRLNMGIPLDAIKPQKPWVKKAMVGDGIPRSNSVADALRLNTELKLKEAGLLSSQGKLTNKALNNSMLLIKGEDLKNPLVIQKLTKNGSSAQEWAKYTTGTPVELTNGQKIQIHFYMNVYTKEIVYDLDFKIPTTIKFSKSK